MKPNTVSDVFWLLLCITGCVDASKSRILGGEDVKAGEYPFVVHIHDNTSMCTGMIIHEEWILTAAHCFNPMKNGSYPKIRVYAGGINYMEATEFTQIVNSKTIIIYEDYSNIEGKVKNDIGLIQVEKPFNFSGCCVKMIALAGGEFPGVSSMSCVVLGFGKTSNDEDNMNKRLHKLSVEASVLEECFRASYYLNHIFGLHPFAYREGTGQRICVDVKQKGQEKDVCSGDSGGPLVCNGLIAGVASHIKLKHNARLPKVDKQPCAMKNGIAVYTSTGPFIAWIREHVPALAETKILSGTGSLVATAWLVQVALCLLVPMW